MSLMNLDLEDLVSIGSANGITTPQSPRSPQVPYYHPVGLTIGETSPSSPNRSVSSGNASYGGNNQAHSIHGVHMHIQENAKVPLLNQPVDRSNSNRSSYPSAQPDGSGFSMGELFFSKESKHRQSRNRNYAGLGSLLDDVAVSGANISSRRPSGDGSSIGDASAKLASADDEAQMEIDALTAAIDPTPWSEIERRMHDVQQSVTANISRQQHQQHQHQQHQQQHQHQHQHQQQPQAPNTTHPHHYNYYTYGRSHQLPIPERMPSPPLPATAPPPVPPPQVPVSSAVMEQALATAAALASVEVPAAGAKPAPPPAPRVPSAPSTTPASALPYTKAQQSPNAARKPPPYHRATYSPPQHAVAHSTSRASVLAAANKKSQYGFGGNHVVQSVPAPPPTANNRSFNKGKPVPPIVPSLSDDGGPNNSGVAYERKKQRAKDARVKLNDAIERLSIAMNLSGSQSKQRSNLLSSRISTTEQRTKSLQITQECAKLAEQAKKWDRPSFVSTAASLVQALNSQCESLSREMVLLQERLDATNGTTGGVPGSVPLPPVQSQSPTALSDHKRHEHPTEATDGCPVKRVKTDSDTKSTENGSATMQLDIPADEKCIFGAVAKLLDPVSLSRCPCVSRRWRTMGVFDDDSTWFQLAVQRFGFFNVRQWTEKLEDGESEETSVSKKVLYRAMNAANVMPHMPLDGLALLGDAKIPGRISGWVFMVERSNGETLRSVKREPSVKASGAGAYQSRPVVELQIVIQNTGMAHNPIIIKNQQITVDVSTRRSGGEFPEISWDDRFSKVVKALDGSNYQGGEAVQSRFDVQGELCRLNLFESAVINLHVDARGCSTTSKFRQRSNFTKLLVSLEGTTVPMVIPFLRDGSQGH